MLPSLELASVQLARKLVWVFVKALQLPVLVGGPQRQKLELVAVMVLLLQV